VVAKKRKIMVVPHRILGFLGITSREEQQGEEGDILLGLD
jgi:hypothetical protein